MFYFVLMMIALTNLALGYAVASHFGLGPKPAAEIDAAFVKEQVDLPSFAILGGSGEETPLDQLPAAKPIEKNTSNEESAEPDASADLSDHDLPSEVRDFAALSEAAPASSEAQTSGDESISK
jgi:hypothetical protein